MGSEAISRGPRGGMPVRPNRGEVRSKEAAEESGERKIKLGCGPSFLLCVVRTVICCEFLIALFLIALFRARDRGRWSAGAAVT